MRTIKAAVNKVLARGGYQIIRKHWPLAEMSQSDIDMIDRVKPFTLTSDARLWSTIIAVRYVAGAGIAGDFVECGVWRGGQALLAALELSRQNQQRNIWLFDTFAGMTKPQAVDRSFNVVAMKMFPKTRKGDASNWCYASLEEVKLTMANARYPDDRIKYVKGPVEQTLNVPSNVPDKIAVLRLDTDWYESTRVEMEILYPRLVSGGVLMIDDYGHWEGARKAIDEYFARHGITPLLQPIDYTGRMMVKP